MFRLRNVVHSRKIQEILTRLPGAESAATICRSVNRLSGKAESPEKSRGRSSEVKQAEDLVPKDKPSENLLNNDLGEKKQNTSNNSGDISDATGQKRINIGKLSHPTIFQIASSHLQRSIQEFILRTQIESSFSVNAFMEDAKRAVTVLMETFLDRDFDSLQFLVVPPLIEELKLNYEKFRLEDARTLGGTAVHSVRVLKSRCMKISILDEKLYPLDYKLDEVVPKKLTAYHDDMFLLVQVDFDLDLRTAYSNQSGSLVGEINNTTTRSVRFARQLPKIYKFHGPLQVLESPWFVAEIHPLDCYL